MNDPVATALAGFLGVGLQHLDWFVDVRRHRVRASGTTWHHVAHGFVRTGRR